ncbi:MAG: hypothetical protein JKX72_01835, partial [Robiginitomaculum sp.]|nr:hypothetical protein [Robiginitomaculum sp.]
MTQLVDLNISSAAQVDIDAARADALDISRAGDILPSLPGEMDGPVWSGGPSLFKVVIKSLPVVGKFATAFLYMVSRADANDLTKVRAQTIIAQHNLFESNVAQYVSQGSTIAEAENIIREQVEDLIYEPEYEGFFDGAFALADSVSTPLLALAKNLFNAIDSAARSQIDTLSEIEIEFVSSANAAPTEIAIKIGAGYKLKFSQSNISNPSSFDKLNLEYEAGVLFEEAVQSAIGTASAAGFDEVLVSDAATGTSKKFGVVGSSTYELLKNSIADPSNSGLLQFEDASGSSAAGFEAIADTGLAGEIATFENLKTAIDTDIGTYSPLLKKGDVATKWEVGGKMAFSDSKNVFTLEKSDNGTSTGLIKKEISVGGEGSSTQLKLDRTDTNGDGIITNADEASNLEVQEGVSPGITGAEIGQAFGSALGQYFSSDNVFEQVAFGAVSSTFFGSVGETIDGLLDGESFDEAANGDGTNPGGFSNFGERLGAKAANLAIGQISSFIVGEVIGGDSFAADFGRATANYFLSTTIAQTVGLEVVTEAAANASTAFSAGGYTFNPATAL